MDALLVSTEEDGEVYFTCEQLTDLVLERAIRLLGRNRDFHYLPAASLTVMRPPTTQSGGVTIGTVTVFRGGRVQWSEGDFGTLAQDWRVPHIYADTERALGLWRSLRDADSASVRGEPWAVEQVKLCPVCGFDLSALHWPALPEASRSYRDEIHLPPLEVPAYETCGGCKITFGVDWIGASFGEMRQWWLQRVCPYWESGELPKDIQANEHALLDFQRLSRDLMRTPTDHPQSCLPATPERKA